MSAELFFIVIKQEKESEEKEEELPRCFLDIVIIHLRYMLPLESICSYNKL